jgi:hypothetical protein
VDTGARSTSADRSPPSSETSRRRLSTVLLVVAAISLTLASVAVWTRATLLDTDRYVAVVSAVAADEQVIATASQRLAAQTVDALDIAARVEAVLPPRAGFLAAPLTERIEARAAEGLARLLATDQAQQLWAGANRRLHASLVAVVRGESSALALEDGVLTLDLFPVVVTAIGQLQANGVIPADVTLPDLSAEEDLEAARQRLGTALGVALPSDLGKVVVADAPALERVRSVVGLLDALVVWLVILTVVAAVGAVVVSTRRTRTVLWMGLLAVSLLVVVRLIISAATSVLTAQVADAEVGATLGSVLGLLTDDLYAWLAGIMLATAALTIVVWLVRHQPWRGLGRPSQQDTLALVLLVVAGGVIWALLGIEAALLGAIVLACWALWSTRRADQATGNPAGPMLQEPTSPDAASTA